MSKITSGWNKMPYDYDKRKIGLYKKDKIMVSTCEVYDGSKPYETAIEHPKYEPQDLIIVEFYSSKLKAKKGHAKWVKKMTSKKLPKKLVDCKNSYISKLCGDMIYKLKE